MSRASANKYKTNVNYKSQFGLFENHLDFLLFISDNRNNFFKKLDKSNIYKYTL